MRIEPRTTAALQPESRDRQGHGDADRNSREAMHVDDTGVFARVPAGQSTGVCQNPDSASHFCLFTHPLSSAGYKAAPDGRVDANKTVVVIGAEFCASNHAVSVAVNIFKESG